MTTSRTKSHRVECDPARAIQKRGRARWSWIFVALFALAACTEIAPVPGAPTIGGFAAQPEVTSVGGIVTLSWSVSGATAVRLDPGGIDVTAQTEIDVQVLSTTTYILVAENEIGSQSRNVVVRVGVLPTITSFGPKGSLVNPGLTTSLEWEVDGEEHLLLRGPGLGAGIDVTGLSEFTVGPVGPSAEYTLVASSADGPVEASAVVSRSVSAVSVLIAGQSNAEGFNLSPVDALSYILADDGVMMLGNDYEWKPAYEPLDDCVGQIDEVSVDPDGGCTTLAGGVSGVSSGVSLGNRLVSSTGGTAFLIPAARGGSTVDEWLPSTTNRYDRTTLFGSAAYRAQLAGSEQGAPLGHSYEGVSTGAVFWYQGESNTGSTSLIEDFDAMTPVVLGTFQQELGAPIILAQLGRRGQNTVAGTTRNQLYQIVRETQRRYDSDSLMPDPDDANEEARPDTYLVVTHDLPMSNYNHLSAAGQVELGRRISLAMREHLFGEDVDGSGPRLVGIDKESPTVVRVHTDRPITEPLTEGADAYAGYFAVFAGGDRLDIASIVRHPNDDRVVKITLAAPAGAVEVRYMPPPITLGPFAYELDVIRSLSCTDPHPDLAFCLPMPAFGAATDAVTATALTTFSAEDDWSW